MQLTRKRIIRILMLAAVLCCTFLCKPAVSAEETAVLHLEAEEGTFFGNVNAKQSSGTGWVEGFKSAGDSEAAFIGDTAEEKVEVGGLFIHSAEQVAVAHGEFIEVTEHGIVEFGHFGLPLFII